MEAGGDGSGASMPLFKSPSLWSIPPLLLPKTRIEAAALRCPGVCAEPHSDDDDDDES